MKKALLTILLTQISIAYDFEYIASSLKGYVIVDVKKISGSFNGCEYDKKIIFEDDTYLTCSGYGYQYVFNPKAVILVNKYNSIKMYVDGTIYDMQN